MPWFKVDDGLHKSRKRIRLGREIEGWAALGLWAHLGSWAADELTEGFISDEEVEYHAPEIGHVLAKRLEAVGLFERVTRYGVDGWLFHDWDDYQPSKEDVLADRAANAARQKRFREKAKAARKAAAQGASDSESNAVSNGGSNAVTDALVAPSVTVPPTRPDPTHTEEQPQTSSVVPRKRGTRIPDDFEVTPEMVTWARKKCPGVDGPRATEAFINYWRAESGARASKRDWVAAWRTWMLREPSGTARRNGSLGLVEHNGLRLKPETIERLDVERFRRMDEELAARQRPAIGGTP